MNKYLIVSKTSDTSIYCMRRLIDVLGDNVDKINIPKITITTKSGDLYKFVNYDERHRMENYDFNIIDELEFSSYLVKILSDNNRKRLFENTGIYTKNNREGI